MASYFKGGMQAKLIWKEDPAVNIWVQESCEWGVEKAYQMKKYIVYTIHLIYSGRLSLED